MASFGKIQESHPDKESVSAHVERVELFFSANGIEENKTVPIFLTSVGSKMYGTLRNLLAPANPKDKSFVDIVAALKGHFEPKPLIIAERFHFHRRNQGSGSPLPRM